MWMKRKILAEMPGFFNSANKVGRKRIRLKGYGHLLVTKV
jgi:hypothetical protein